MLLNGAMSSIKRNIILFQPTPFGSEIVDQLSEHQWSVFVAQDLMQAANLFNTHFFYVGLCMIETCDSTIQLNQINQLLQSHSHCNWILGLSNQSVAEITANSVVSKLIAGNCFDYITLPVDTERLLFVLGHAFGMNEISQPDRDSINNYPSGFGIIGNSPAMLKLFRSIQKISNEDCSVLIEGETGTGKELVANAIHRNSRRKEYPFVAINCGSYPKGLIQSELFGYEKGAFTGAHQQRIGLIESAQNGTLFLDEIGDLPLEQQVNLLRFLEERTIERVGSSIKIPIDVRILAATNVDLKIAILKKEFREDLYYRLRVIRIKTPPLRKRGSDIELLASYFFDKFSATKPYKADGFHSETLELMRKYDWPGNVRELLNSVRHAVVMSENKLLTPGDMNLNPHRQTVKLKTLEEARILADQEAIVASLRHNRHNMTRTANTLGISRMKLYRLLVKHKLVT